MNLEQYAQGLHQEVAATAEVDRCSMLEAFVAVTTQRLVESGDVDEPQTSLHKKTGIEVAAWAHDPETGRLQLFVAAWHGNPADAPALTTTDVKKALRRLVTFAERCTTGYSTKLEETDPVWEVADLIARDRKTFSAVHLIVLSDRPAGSRLEVETSHHDVLGHKASVQVWDLERFHRLDTSGLEREPITVLLSDYLDRPVACLAGPDSGDHRVLLAVLPATFLAEIYDRYGARLLERNVRSFLQARGAVNKGIKTTILTEPDRFLAYNNGISATASEVTLGAGSDGTHLLLELKDLQIVNGGQTTASLHNAATRDRADLSRIAVQAKITVVTPEVADELVPWISKYSNTQNKVSAADLSANDPFHISVEEMSRTVWAPAAEGTTRQSQWFYERARGQYIDEQARAGNRSKQKKFKLTHPTAQRFTKTDLAKFLNTWDQYPHIVSLGAQKNFMNFMQRLPERRITADQEFFERLVATAILFRTAERLVQRQQFGGYRSQIVTYTVAKLSHASSQRLNLSDVWQSQALTDAAEAAIIDLSHQVHPVLVEPPGAIRNISEWAKKLDCWKTIQELEWSMSPQLASELIEFGKGRAPAADLFGPSHEEQALIDEAAAVEGAVWFEISSWAKETGNLQPWQRSLSFSLGRLAGQGRPPSIKQARQGLKLHAEALRLGFQAGP